MSGPNTADQVPTRYDLLVDGWGFVVDRVWDPNSLRHPPSSYEYTSTFVERSNVSGDYGDNQQAFWLTASQRDWSLGESRSHFDPNTPEGSRMFYSSSGIDPTVEGEIALAGVISSSGVSAFASGVSSLRGYIARADSHLYSLFAGDLGAHGLGTATTTIYGMCQDSNAVYMASTSAGTVGVRRYDIIATTFGTFSATACDSIAYNGNVLYGAVNSTAVLQSYSTAGAATPIYTWKDSAGNARKQTFLRLLPFGGDLLILIQPTNDRAELWLYDGTSTYMVAKLPQNFEAYEMVEVEGVVFLSGSIHTSDNTAAISYVPAIFTYINGNLDELWRPPGAVDNVGNIVSYAQRHPALAGWHNTLLFTSPTDLMRYNPSSGAIHSLGAVTTGLPTAIVAWEYQVSVFTGTTQSDYRPGQAATTGTVTSSAIDFGSSLTKNVRGISIFWSGAAGTSVDISYALDGATSFTSLKVGAVSGTEYTIGTTARVVKYRLTLHGSGASNYNTPAVTRVYVRAVAILPPYRLARLILDCTGRFDVEAPNPVVLRDNTFSTVAGLQLATNLRTIATTTTPVSITDEFGTYTGIIEAGDFQLEKIRPLEYRAFVTLREV